MVNFLILAALAAVPAEFSVQPLEGPSVRGVIESLDGENLTLRTDAGPQKLAVRELLIAKAENAPKTATTAAIRIELVDGSTLNAKEFARDKDTGRIKLANDQMVEAPMRALRFVRFKDPSEKSTKLDAQWKEIVGGEHAADLLVVRKKGAIDFTEGVVGNISADKVKFTLDGDEIDVNREKVEGLVFAQTPAELPEAVCAVSDALGAKVNVAKLALNGDVLEATTQSGVKLNLQFASITQLDFSSGKVAYLSDLEPESFNYQPFFAAPTELPSLGSFYHLRRDAGFESPVLKLDGKQYPKGIALHSRSKVVYKLPGKFRKFTALVGIDDEARDGGGDVAMEILGDAKSLWSGRVRGADPAQALELDITGVKKLEIVVDYGDGQDVADHLDLAAAKVTK